MGSSNPLGINANVDKISFYPYFYVKDMFAILILFCSFGILIHYFPNILGHPDNYIEANPLQTPEHIVPEWYFLPFYAILRSIPNKLGGILLMLSAILIILILPISYHYYQNKKTLQIQSPIFKPIYRKTFWFFVFNVLLYHGLVHN